MKRIIINLSEDINCAWKGKFPALKKYAREILQQPIKKKKNPLKQKFSKQTEKYSLHFREENFQKCFFHKNTSGRISVALFFFH